MRRLLTSLVLALLAVAAVPLVTAASVGAAVPTSGYAVSDFATGFANSGGAGPIGIAADSSGHIFVGDVQDRAIYRFGPAGGIADGSSRIATLDDSPSGLAFDKHGNLYALRFNDLDLVQLDPTTGAVLRTGIAHFDNNPRGLATDPLSGDLFVTVATTVERVSDFENGPGTVTTYASGLPVDPDDGIAFTPGGTIFVADQDNVMQIAATDQTQPATMRQIATVAEGDGIAVGAGDARRPPFLLVNRNDGAITKLDLSQDPPVATDIVTAGSRGDFVVVGPDRCLYATQTDRIIKVTNADGSCSLAPTLTQSRQGSFACSATALRLGSTSYADANRAYQPCVSADATKAVVSVSPLGVTLGLSALDAATVLSPADLGRAPAVGDHAAAAAGAARVTVRIGLTTVTLGVLQARAGATCVATGSGLEPALTGWSSVGTASISTGLATTPLAVGDRPLSLPIVGIGVLHLNATLGEPGAVTQRALWFESTTGLLPSIVVGEARAGYRGNPCSF